MRRTYNLLVIFIFILIPYFLYSQGVGINPTGNNPDQSAGLDVDFSNKGVLIPRVALISATDNTTIPNPATSLLVYNTGTGGLTPAGYYYNSGTPSSPNWVRLETSGSGNNFWSLSGNAITASDFFGSTNNQPLIFRTNNTERMRITESGLFGLGVTNPVHNFDLSGTARIRINNNAWIDLATPGGYPGIAFYNNSNVQIGNIYVTNSGLGFGYQGPDELFISPNPPGSRIGIATNNPQEKLHLVGSFRAEGDISLFNNDNTAKRLFFYEPSSGGTEWTSFEAQSQTSSIRYLLPATLGSVGQALTITNLSGNIATLDWTNMSASNAWGLYGNSISGTEWLGTTNNQPLRLATNNNERVRITETGNIGIGTTTPTELLHLQSGNLRLDNGSILIQNNDNTARELRLFEPSGSGTNFTSFQAQAQANDISYILPSTNGSVNQVLSIASVSGNTATLQWTTPSGGGNSWLLTGNSGTTAWDGSNGNFLGTTDNQPLVIATTNTSSPQPIQFWAGNQQVLQLNPPGTSAPAWSIQRDNGGNNRGFHAVDLQSNRTNASSVASGSYSVISGGQNNTASGSHSTVSGGEGNSATAPWTTVGGGMGNTASGYRSAVFAGGGNTASGSESYILGGTSNVISGSNSAIIGGRYLQLGNYSFGFSGQSSTSLTNLSSFSNIGALVDVDLWLYNVRNQASQLRLFEPSSSGTNFTSFQAQAQANDISYILPSTIGSVNQVLSIASVSGNTATLQWTTPSGGGNSWLLTGNSGTTAWDGSNGNFLGTTDNQPLVIATTNTSSPQPIQLWAGNQQVLRLNPPGTSAPAWSIQRDNGGNQRGYGAVDLQFYRVTFPDRVASGNYSAVLSGHTNKASALTSLVVGGASNQATGTLSAIVGGSNNQSNGFASFIGGGGQNYTNGSYSVIAGGTENYALGNYSTIIGGYNLRLGNNSFGYSGQTSNTPTNLSSFSNIGALVDVDLWLYNVRNQASQLRLFEPSGSGTNFTSFQAQAQANDINYVLPSTIGSANQVLSIASVSGNTATLQWANAGGGSGWSLTGNSGTNPSTNFVGTTDNQPLAFRTNNTETMRINTDGYVGIGTNNPSHPFRVRKNVSTNIHTAGFTNENDYGVFLGSVNNQNYGSIIAWGGSAPAPLILQSSGFLGIGSFSGTTMPQVKFHYYDYGSPLIFRLQNSAQFGPASIEFVSDPIGHQNEWRPGYIISGDNGTFTGRLDFFTNGTGYANRWGSTLAMSVTNGRVGIGTYTPSYQLQLTQDAAAKPSTNTWTVASDARLKDITGHYEKGLNEITKLEPITYKYKENDHYKFDSTILAKEHIGFVAQEVQKIFPEAVTVDENGILGLNIHPILVAFVNAFKELNEKTDDNNNKIAELQKVLDLLKSLINENQKLSQENKELKQKIEVLEANQNEILKKFQIFEALLKNNSKEEWSKK